MADPIRQKIIGIKVPAANIGERVKVTNLTRGGQFYATIQGTDRNAIINQGDDFSWMNGDTILGEVFGRIYGSQRVTIQSGGANMQITATVDTSTPGAVL